MNQQEKKFVNYYYLSINQEKINKVKEKLNSFLYNYYQTDKNKQSSLPSIHQTLIYILQKIMLSAQTAKQLGIEVQVSQRIQSPSFKTQKPLWVKEQYHHQLEGNELTQLKKYQYTKLGKIFSFERTRYITCWRDHLFYFEEENSEKFKGYCCFRDLYVGFYPLKDKRFLLYLSNGNEESMFYFDSDQFYLSIKKTVQKLSILVNFSQQYLIQNSLGKGSFSQVYLVKHKVTQELYAAKLIPKIDKNKSPTKNLVQEERRILQLISSQYIYQFYQFYQENDNYVFILEYLDGKDLMTLFKEQIEFSMADLIFIFRSILTGIADMHKLKIYHRDLKPQNIIINMSNLKPKIIDFGLSLLIHSYTQLKSFKRCGTMGYMAPEVIANTSEIRKPYTEKCDIFSLGIIAHMILLGKNPLKGKTYQETYSKNKICEIQLDKEDIVEKYGEDCFTFLSKMLQKNPKLRYSAQQALRSEFMNINLEQKIVKNQKQESAQTASQQLKHNKVKSVEDNEVVD